MAPAKREFETMMFDYDPVFEIDVIAPTYDAVRPVKRCKEAAADLSKYVDDEYDVAAQALEQLDFDGLRDDLAAVTKSNPFLGRAEVPARPSLDVLSSAFDDWSEMSSDSDDTGYNTMFNSPAHVLDAQYDVPFSLDPSSLAEAAEGLLGSVEAMETTDAMIEEVVKALSAPSSPASSPSVSRESTPSPTPSPSMSSRSSPSPVEVDDDEVPPAHAVTKTGKPVNPTRWAHNSTERKRRLEIRKLFSGLRDLFPEIAGDDKISNITTLNRAIDHVAELKRVASEQEKQLASARERNAMLRQRAEECLARRKQEEEDEDVPPEAAALLSGCPNAELRKTLPAALRQLLDHNSRGPVEQKPLARRRPKHTALRAEIMA